MSDLKGGPRPNRLHAEEVDVKDGLVRRLVDTQFPEWAELPLRRLSSTGTDNAIYRLGQHFGIRLPRIHWAVAQIAKEHKWLLRLGPHLPVPVPEPVVVGEPDFGYPFPWLVYRWIDGADAMVGPVDDWVGLARQVARFVIALQSIDTVGAPPAGGRAGPLGHQDRATRLAIERLETQLPARQALAVWDEALIADPWPGPPLWVHADLLSGNLVVNAGGLSGVIDWSSAGIGDPACDAMLAWDMPAKARAVYRDALGFDDHTWARGRGWALHQAMLFVPYYTETIPDGVDAARRRLERLLADDDRSEGVNV